MCASGHHAHHIFKHEFGQRQCRKGTVDRGDHDRAPGRQQSGNGVGKYRSVGNMLDDLRGIDHIKLLAGFGKCLGGAAAIVDLQIIKGGMGGSSFNRRAAGIDAGHGGTQTHHWFRQQSATAANIKNAQSRQRFWTCQVFWSA